jgi:aryl-alcohol dehydrogenase-like predicted oxidoreductase
MALAPWNVLGGGHFQTKAQIEERQKSGEGIRKMLGGKQTENEVKISEALDKVRGELGAKSITAVALAYVLQKQPYVFPVSGSCMDAISSIQ